MYMLQVLMASTTIDRKFRPSNVRGSAVAHCGLIHNRKRYRYALFILYNEHLNMHMYLIQVLVAFTAIESKFGPSNAVGHMPGRCRGRLKE